MADIAPCNIRAPHERHSWQEVTNNDELGIRIGYHLCNGKRWQNAEVYEKLKALITDVLKEENKQYWRGGLNPATRITEAIWQDIVGFIQPEDMPTQWDIDAAKEDIQNFKLGNGRVMLIPPDPQERIANAVEKIAKFTDNFHICDHGNIEAFCEPCKMKKFS
jgi:hypothetical protein